MNGRIGHKKVLKRINIQEMPKTGRFPPNTPCAFGWFSVVGVQNHTEVWTVAVQVAGAGGILLLRFRVDVC